jgi:GT2 family glycosyltransferase
MSDIIPNIYAVIVNWNRPDDTCICIQSLLDVDGYTITIIVVDNGSTDRSVEVISGRFPQVILLKQASNLGFAGGYNAGLRQALEFGADFVFIINNDAWIDSAAFQHLFQCFSPDTAAVCPLIFYASKPDIIWSSGAISNRFTLEIKDEFENQPISSKMDVPFLERDFVTGCGMLLTREALLKIGLFDEDFHLYYEDMDFSRRIRKAGWRLRVNPRAKMWHKVSSSSGGRGSLNERYWMARSSVRFFRKHAVWWQIPPIIFWRTGSAILNTWRLARYQRWSSIIAFWNGLKDGMLDGFR